VNFQATMSDSTFWPSIQPLDDPGTDSLSNDKSEAFGLQADLDKSCDVEDIAARVKAVLQPDNATPTNDETESSGKKIVSKASQIQKEISESFPLEPRSVFYSRLLQANRGKATEKQIQKDLGTYVSLDPSQKAIAAKQKELLLNEKLLKSLESSMAGDAAHVIEARVGKRTLKKQRKEAKEKGEGLGPAWFGMKAPEVTEEVQRDLEVLKMRGAMDPKRFYKKTGGAEGEEALPKYFQMGHVVDSPVDYYSSKGSTGGGKNKKKSLVDQLMADAEYQKFSKRKYAEIVDEKAKLDPRNRHKKKKSKKPKVE